MHDFIIRLFIRGVALIPLLVIVSASAWLVTNKLGYLQLAKPFTATDVRTWSLAFTSLAAAIYGAIFAVILSALGDTGLSVAIASGTASLVTLRAAPLLASRYRS